MSKETCAPHPVTEAPCVMPDVGHSVHRTQSGLAYSALCIEHRVGESAWGEIRDAMAALNVPDYADIYTDDYYGLAVSWYTTGVADPAFWAAERLRVAASGKRLP